MKFNTEIKKVEIRMMDFDFFVYRKKPAAVTMRAASPPGKTQKNRTLYESG